MISDLCESDLPIQFSIFAQVEKETNKQKYGKKSDWKGEVKKILKYRKNSVKSIWDMAKWPNTNMQNWAAIEKMHQFNIWSDNV